MGFGLEYLEKVVTSLGLSIAFGVYLFLFVTVAVYIRSSDFLVIQPGLSQSFHRDGWFLPKRHLRGNLSTPAFRNTEELRLAVDTWLDDKEEAVLMFGHISTWNVSLIEDMAHLFEDAVEFIDEDLSGWDVSSVKNMSCMFRGTKWFTGASISTWNVSSVVDFSRMFEDSAFEGDISRWSTQMAEISLEKKTEVHVEDIREMDGLSQIADLNLEKRAEGKIEDLRETDDLFEMVGSFERDWNTATLSKDDVKTRVGIGNSMDYQSIAICLGFISYGMILTTLLTNCYRRK